MSRIEKIISERTPVEHIEYRREFQAVNETEGNGFSFPCEPDGTLIQDESYDVWIKNYEYCVSHPEKYVDEGVRKVNWNYTEPAVAKCSCGREIRLDGDVRCECGQWYNQFGQALRNPEFWEDEY